MDRITKREESGSNAKNDSLPAHAALSTPRADASKMLPNPTLPPDHP
jgi:hypothetical protein